MLYFFFKDFIFIYYREREREREAETQAEGEAGPMQGAQLGTPTRVSRITPQAAGGAKLLRHGDRPRFALNYFCWRLRRTLWLLLMMNSGSRLPRVPWSQLPWPLPPLEICYEKPKCQPGCPENVWLHERGQLEQKCSYGLGRPGILHGGALRALRTCRAQPEHQGGQAGRINGVEIFFQTFPFDWFLNLQLRPGGWSPGFIY